MFTFGEQDKPVWAGFQTALGSIEQQTERERMSGRDRLTMMVKDERGEEKEGGIKK